MSRPRGALSCRRPDGKNEKLCRRGEEKRNELGRGMGRDNRNAKPVVYQVENSGAKPPIRVYPCNTREASSLARVLQSSGSSEA